MNRATALFISVNATPMNSHIQILDHQFRPFISASEIDKTVHTLAERISADYNTRNPLLCPVLTGSYLFAADLSRALSIPHEVQFVRYTSYDGLASTGTVQEVLPFDSHCTGRHVIIVEDVVDTGLSMQTMLHKLYALHPLSVAICSFFFKPDAFKGDFKIDYIGRNLTNDFIVGYGLDYNGAGRHYGEVYVIDD